MDMSSTFRLTLFASPALATADGTPLTGRAAQRHKLALLALLARSPGATVSRDVLMAHLWPESDVEQARNLLKVSVYVLRQVLGDGAIVSSGDGLRLGHDVVEVDVVDFESALERGEHERASNLYHGPFLEGFFLKDAPEFGQWVDRERARLADAYAGALEALATEAEKHDVRASVEWWKALAAHDPLDSRVAARLMSAMAASGHRAGALRHGAIHARLLRDELDIEPSAAVRALMERLRLGEETMTIQEPGQRQVVSVTDGPPLPSSPVPDQVATSDSAAPALGVVDERRVWAGPVVVGAALLLLTLFAAWPRGGERPGGDTDSMADDIARAVVRELSTGSGGGTVPSARPPTRNVTAWELYVRAAQPEVLRSDSAAAEALAMLRTAAALDPNFAGAHAGMARLYVRVGPPEDPDLPRSERFELARQHALRAVELDGSLAEAYATLGIAEMSLYDFETADRHLRRAIELDPKNSRAREWLVQLSVWMGRFDEALIQAERALEDDPLSPSATVELARALMVNGRCDEALGVLEPLADLRPPLLRAGPIAAQCLAQSGLWDEAVAEMSKGLSGAGARGQASFAYFLARAGRTDEASAILVKLLEDAQRRGGQAFLVAMVYAGLEQTDECFQWLEGAMADHSMTHELREPRFADLEADPRFPAILERLGLR